MTKLARWMVASALWLAPMAEAAGAAPAWTEIDAQVLIDRCREVSQEDLNSDSTLRIGEGLAVTIDCLESEIVHHGTAFLEGWGADEIRELVADLGRTYGRLYFAMANENVGCDPSCGSALHNAGAWELAELLEKILRDLVAERNHYQR